MPDDVKNQMNPAPSYQQPDLAGLKKQLGKRVLDDRFSRGGGEVHTGSRQVQVKLGVLCVKREIAFGLLECGVNHSAGHAKAAVFTEDRADGLTGFNAVRCGVFKANLLENTVDVVYDGFEVLIGKRMIAAAAFSGPHRL